MPDTQFLSGMTFTAQLQKSCSSSWERAVNHPFTKELKDKRLSPPVFARYLLQASKGRNSETVEYQLTARGR